MKQKKRKKIRKRIITTFYEISRTFNDNSFEDIIDSIFLVRKKIFQFVINLSF